MDPTCLPSSPWKGGLEAASHVAEVLIALIAVWPMLVRAVWLMRTTPPMSDDERAKRIELLVSGRMGWFQRFWTLFLECLRRQPQKLLSWKESRARLVWCPVSGHKIGEIEPAGSRLSATCVDCRARKVAETEEAIRRWASDGLEDPFGGDSNPRERVDPNAKLIAEIASKFAEEHARIVDPP